MAKKFNWRKIFSYEYKRCDYDCVEIWTNEVAFRLVKYPGNYEQPEGKWCLFAPNEKMLGRYASKNAPLEWADSTINQNMK